MEIRELTETEVEEVSGGLMETKFVDTRVDFNTMPVGDIQYKNCCCCHDGSLVAQEIPTLKG